MDIAVVGAGVGRTGTHSLKLALEQLLGAPCHHMLEIMGDETQVPAWTDAIHGRPINWPTMLDRYRAIVDWPGAAFWRELSAAYPDALVLLSVREPEDWYKSASNTIFVTLEHVGPDDQGWGGSVRKLLHDRFSNQIEDPTAMMDAFIRHNDEVRSEIPAERLLEWRPGDGWDPICDRLGLAVPTDPFPRSNTTDDFRQMMDIPPIAE